MLRKMAVRYDFPIDHDANVPGRRQDVDAFERVFGVDEDFCIFFEPFVDGFERDLDESCEWGGGKWEVGGWEGEDVGDRCGANGEG